MRGARLLGLVRRPPAVVAVAYLAGSVPFSNVVARWRTGRDLRQVGTGTVSGSGLYEVAGFPSLVLGGSLDVVKGAVGPLLAGPDRPVLAAVSGAAGVGGHNWSVFLRGRGGRGISPAIGALLVRNWPGAGVLLGGLAGGRLFDETGLGSALADGLLVPVLAATRGRRGALAGAAITGVLVTKRLAGNQPAREPSAYLYRLLFDRDTRHEEPAQELDPASDPADPVDLSASLASSASSHHHATPASPGPV
jgi:glycerol-3-phosphate acyltransferase PlsY